MKTHEKLININNNYQHASVDLDSDLLIKNVSKTEIDWFLNKIHYKEYSNKSINLNSRLVIEDSQINKKNSEIFLKDKYIKSENVYDIK